MRGRKKWQDSEESRKSLAVYVGWRIGVLGAASAAPERKERKG